MKKVIITGGRDYNDVVMVEDVLNFIRPDIVIHGDCSGADTIAKNWAKERFIKDIPYPYLSEYGKAGGPIRNKQMCSENTDAIVIAFPGGKGTENCIKEAVKLNMIVMRVEA